MSSPPLLDYAGYVFDLDGTLYLGPNLIPDVDLMLAELRRMGKKIRFLSNKPLQSRRDYAKKLRGFGVQVDDDEVMNSTTVAVRYLKEHYPGAKLLVCGEGPLISELVEGGFPIVNNGEECDLLLLSFDRNFHYMKLYESMIAARRGVPIIATNPDNTCPVDNGVIPDCGANMAALEACSGRQVDIVIGKPSDIMLKVVLEDIGEPADKVLLTGDRLETDMRMGRLAGMGTALVLTGVTNLEQAMSWPEKPTYILESAAEIVAVR
ncbi:MAG: HAD-IIA family hydrolase [Candidatus Omnitrophica bacterium]|nr:HAD-IIA family hydrolase [Candidatus Omnitrophota bacterium]